MFLERLHLWIDPAARPGPEAMAVDQWLLETAESPVLRVYRWLGDWGSIGYFGDLADAVAAFPSNMKWVRRWTGGGTVDHRDDWTYTLVVPHGETLAGLKGAESYRRIHGVLAETLRLEGLEARLSTGTEETGASLCFENPVSHDLLGPGGRKLAGAGQRRTKRGLLHQGSVAAGCAADVSATRGSRLAALISSRWESRGYEPPEHVLADLVNTRYGSTVWTRRR